MGTYTPNYGLYKPDVGETDWGDKVNANFDTIDNVMHENRSQIGKIKKDVLTIALNVMMHKALLHAETKDFYSIIADVITDEYPNGYKNTFETVPFVVTFDNGGGGTWTQAIKITLTTVPSEYAQYRIVIQSDTMQIYAADGTLKAEYGAETGVTSEFWNNVKSDGSDIRIADQNYAQLYFWIEEFDYSGKYAVIWVKVEAGTSELYIVYGNANALPSAYNDGEQVFEFFDDFDTDEKWSLYGNSSIHDSVLDYTLGAGDYVVEKVKQLPSRNIVIEHLTKVVSRIGPNAGINIMMPTTTAGDNDEAVSGNWYLVAFESVGYLRIYQHTNTTYSEIYEHTYNIPIGQWLKCKTILKEESPGVKISFYVNGSLITSLAITKPITPQDGYLAFREGDMEHDWVRVLKLADPAEFGDAEVITLVTTEDFITVTFDFPEGVDKLLITADTDATTIYYSTDDGVTWNPITPDTETPLPETAYSVKWKFENATYVRGYAFITW